MNRPNVVDVETWLVRLSNGWIASVWVPIGSPAADAVAEAKREHGANAVAVRRPADTDWTEIPADEPLSRRDRPCVACSALGRACGEWPLSVTSRRLWPCLRPVQSALWFWSAAPVLSCCTAGGARRW